MGIDVDLVICTIPPCICFTGFDGVVGAAAFANGAVRCESIHVDLIGGLYVGSA